MQVVFQITSAEADAHKAMLGQLFNLLADFNSRQQRIAVEVVVHGLAFPLLYHAPHPFAEKVVALQQQAVRWLICRNTMDSHDIKASQLFPFVEVVPAAIAHLVTRQHEGWAYIRC
ncbi:DsrE family protein [Chitinophaga vietnamensis]|uniref:DsrE family protein n=1 Tax=Chitinophaga vietnamensis TaxID=2593957 RepID=UPI001177A93A|nr:DsrE family protein [Chitinophaga vietnamensis]